MRVEGSIPLATIIPACYSTFEYAVLSLAVDTEAGPIFMPGAHSSPFPFPIYRQDTRSGLTFPRRRVLVRHDYVSLAIGAIVLVILVVALFKLLGGVC